MANRNSITVAVAARNEEAGLAKSVAILMNAVQSHFGQYEVLIYDDSSTDATGKIADDLATCFEHVVVIHHPHSRGVGGIIRAGLERARMQYFIWIDGKGATTASALDKIFAHCGQADLVIPYPTNQHERPLLRRIISRAFQSLHNFVFGLNLHYYNHLVLSKVADARRYQTRSTSHAAQADMLVRMLRDGHTFIEVGVQDNFDFKFYHTKAFYPRNVVGVGALFLGLVWDIYVRRKSRREVIVDQRVSAVPER